MKKIACPAICLSFLPVFVLIVLSGCSNNVATESSENNAIQVTEPEDSIATVQPLTVQNTVVLPSGVPPIIEINEGNVNIHDVIFSPDEKKFVTRILRDGTVRVWDVGSGNVHEIKLEEEIAYYPFSPVGKKMVTCNRDGIVRTWDIDTGKKLQEWKLEGSFYIFSPDEKKIVTAGGKEFRIWDAESGKELYKLPEVEGYFRGFSPDGKKIVTVSENIPCRLWDAESGKKLQEFKLEGRFYHDGLTPDGKRIITICDERTLHIWDLESGEELKLEGYFSALSPDGKKIATQDNGIIRLWDVESREKLQEWKLKEWKQERRCYSLFSPDGMKVFVKLYENEMMGNTGVEFGIWNVESGEELKFVGTFLGFSPDGKKILTREGATMLIWDTESGKELWQLEGMDGRFSPDGRKIITQDYKSLNIWDFATLGKQIAYKEAKQKAERIAEEEKQKEFERETEERLQRMLTKASDFKVELRKSGLANVSEFAQFGTAERKRSLQQGNALERAKAAHELGGVREEINQKMFFYEYEYTYNDSDAHVDLEEKKSRFMITIPTGFYCRMFFDIEKFTFPLPDVSVKDVTVGASHVTLTLEGNVKSFEELALKKDHYRVQVWFTNLQHENGITTADVLKIAIVDAP